MSKNKCKGKLKSGDPCTKKDWHDGYCWVHHPFRDKYKNSPRLERKRIQRKQGNPAKWPKGEVMPDLYSKHHRLYPCKRCRTVLLKNGGQAVYTMRKGAGFVVMRCKQCNKKFTMNTGIFVFPKKIECEKCGGKTRATSTLGEVQYRKCRACDHNMTVFGTDQNVKPDPPDADPPETETDEDLTIDEPEETAQEDDKKDKTKEKTAPADA